MLRLYHFVNPLFVFPDKSDTRFDESRMAMMVISPNGFKDIEFRSEKVNGTRRLVGIGDSFVFGISHTNKYKRLAEV